MRRRSASGRSGGFTLIELIVVLVLVSVLAAYVTLRWTSAGAATVAYQAELFARNLRHAQSLAMTQGVTLTMNVTATGYDVRNGATVINDPAAGGPFSVALANNVTFTAGTGTFNFDSLGRPRTGAGLIAVVRSYTLNGDGTTWTVTVAPLTGFVTVATP